MFDVTTLGIDLAKNVFSLHGILLVMGARSVLQRAARERDPLSRWASGGYRVGIVKRRTAATGRTQSAASDSERPEADPRSVSG
jgi:hypothetical protein